MKAQRVFSGIDHLGAAMNTGLSLLLGVAVYLSSPPGLSVLVLAALAVAMLAAVGTRYRLLVFTDGIEWTSLVAWVLPVRRLRYLLDADIDIYESFEAVRPEGVCVRPFSVRSSEKESPCFGPSFDQAAIASLWARANEAIGEARQRLPATPGELRCRLLPRKPGSAQVLRRNWQGRAREAKLLDDVLIGRLLLPAGSMVEFDCESYLDPRREDQLVAVISKTALRLPSGIEVPPETRISIGPSGEVSAVRGALGLLELDGFPVDGSEVIGLDAEGHLDYFTLGSAHEMAGWSLSTGTTFHTWPSLFGQGPSWYCTLRGSLRLPELELQPGDSAVFDKATQKLAYIYPHREHRLEGMVVRSGPVVVHADGRIDRKCCTEPHHRTATEPHRG